ncbi:4'-phosphopantetheinyl transferase superfamily protein [Roseomonas terrae]|uniref:4'-phosphopantetheinyl transferase superfamily protein n=2 Tax=Neoroseomonas terrae TaxID=424799 RepID=A0ABS5EGN3_9PROT|nr:4'-phosphopantetheinyl transferase superfamily protein [Neoroseomonas terrae]MBR0649827.1 4'-phosphopantetheinyl transferase superfamily protein [Neoroseomonas terrae]
MRVVLADRIGVLPLSLRFESGPHGKPMLQGAGRERWRFNLAHSRQLAVLAVSDDPAVDLGIDLEWLHRRVSSDLIRGATAAEERAFLVNLPPASRAAWFLRLWTQKESVLKADGAGLSVPPAEVVFDMPHARLRRLPSRLGSAEAFAVHDVSAPPGHVATLTVRDRWRRPIAVRSATE